MAKGKQRISDIIKKRHNGSTSSGTYKRFDGHFLTNSEIRSDGRMEEGKKGRREEGKKRE